MRVIDNRGRFLGAVNAFDGLVLLGVGIAAVAVVSGYGVARPRAPEMTSVSPTTLVAGTRTRIKLGGLDFRPGLTPFFEKNGTPFMIGDGNLGAHRGTFLISTPESAEIESPELTPGTYDIYLFENGRQAAFRPAVFHVESPRAPRGMMDVKVRFFVPPESVHLLQAGDQDRFEPKRPTDPTTEGALVREAVPVPGVSETLEMHWLEEENRWIGARMPMQAIDATLAVPVIRNGETIVGYKDATLSPGAIFTLTTDRYRFRGVIQSVSAMTPVADEAPRLKGTR